MTAKATTCHFYTRVAIILGALSTSLAACSTEPVFAKKEAEAALASAESPEPQEYRIQAGDQLDVKFYYNPEVNATSPVRPDGKISLQLVGDVTAAGLTPSELSAAIAQKYAQELRRPAVTVIVKSFTGRQIYVGGEVEKEGPVDLIKGMTALQAVIKAGGFKESAEPEEVIVIRQGTDHKPIPYRVDLKRAYSDPYQADLRLQPYDVVYVSKSFIAEADKFVKQYISDLLLFRGWGITVRGFSLESSGGI